VSYAESQQLHEQERLGMTTSRKTFDNPLRRQPGDSSNPSTIDRLLAALYESDFVYRTRHQHCNLRQNRPNQLPTSIYSASYKGGKERKRTNKAAGSKGGRLVAESQPRE